MKKKILLISLIFFLIINVSAITLGDINNDGKVSSLDYILVRKHLLGTLTLTNTQKTSADVNSDNKISSLDYIKIKQIVINSGKIEATPTPKPTPKSTPKPTPKPTYTCNISYDFSTNKISLSGTASNSSKVKKTVIDGKERSTYSPIKSGTYKGEITFADGGVCSKTVKVTVPTYTCNITYNASTNEITMTGSASNSSKVKKIVIDGKENSTYSPIKSGTYKGEITFADNGKCSKNVKATISPSSSKSYIDAYFLNSHGSGSKYSMGNVQNNEAFIFKAGGKYILLDTGVEDSTIVKIIYDKLKELQNETKVTIDYLILSHMHRDHIGNAVSIINNSKIQIKNLILKRESQTLDDVNKIVKAANAKKINIVYANEKYSEGQLIDLNGFVKLYFFNVKDVYSGVDCSKKDRYIGAVNQASTDEDGEDETKYAKTTSGKYMYFNGKDLFDKGADMKISTSSKVEFNRSSTNGSLINSRYYLVYGGKVSQCSPNSNSLALVFQVITTDGTKYMYLPSDLQNSGYSPFGEYDSTYKTTIYGYNTTYNFEYTILSDGTLGFTLKDGKLVRNTSVPQIKRPQEYLTARNIVKKFSDFKNNLVIYQQAHHGINNERDAINTLKVNRTGVFSIVARRGNPSTHSKYTVVEAQELLNKTTIMVAGDKLHNGVKCVIKGSGKAECAYYN